MRTSEDRVAELHRRMHQRARAKKARRYLRTAALSAAACLAVVVLFAYEISRTAVHGQAAMNSGAAASIFAEHAALGYVVVAIVAFCLGALVAVLCYRMKKRMHDEETPDD